MMERSQEAAQILIRTFEALARQLGKRLSERTRADITRACELLAAGDDYEDLLEDLLSTPPIRSDRTTQSFEREPIPTEEEQLRRFGAWRRQRDEDAR